MIRYISPTCCSLPVFHEAKNKEFVCEDQLSVFIPSIVYHNRYRTFKGNMLRKLRGGGINEAVS